MQKAFKSALAVLLILCMMPLSALAALIDFDESADGCDFYQVITKNDYNLAPGAVETEMILNDATGANRNVVRVIEVDLKNPNISIMPTYMGLNENSDFSDSSQWKKGALNEQAAYVEETLGLNVVGGMNTNLRYTSNHPYGVLVWNGVVYSDERKDNGSSTAQTFLSVTKDGVASLHSASEPIPEDSWQAISANFGWIIKDGVNQYATANHNDTDRAPRSVIGIKADGTLVLLQNDGRQSPYSVGSTMHELADWLLSLGCVDAVNCDGGGSSTFISEREGTGDLSVKSVSSDGSIRETLGGILVISKATADGKFDHAALKSDVDYITPGNTATFTATGTDSAGGPAEIPSEGITWNVDEAMGTVTDGVFTSNGTAGTATVQMIYNGEVVGEDSVEVVVPTGIKMTKATYVLPYGETTKIEVKVTVNDGLNEVKTKTGDVVFSVADSTLGTFDGDMFTAAAESDTSVTSTITATIAGTDISASAPMKLGKASHVFGDFEAETVGAKLYSFYNEHFLYVSAAKGNTWAYIVDSSTGKVKNGEKAVAVHFDASQIFRWSSYQNFYISNFYSKHKDADGNRLYLSGATGIGVWIYVPEEMIGIKMSVLTKSNDGNDTEVLHELVPLGYTSGIEREGWYYFTADVSDLDYEFFIKWIYLSVYETTTEQAAAYGFDPDNETNMAGEYTLYFDDWTVDYSDAVADREVPEFTDIYISRNSGETSELMNGQKVTDSVLNVYTNASDFAADNSVGLDIASAKAYVDGVEITNGFTCDANGKLYLSDIELSEGMHSFKFEIADANGNASSIKRRVYVDATEAEQEITIVPKDPDAEDLVIGSTYWIDVKAMNIENIDKVVTTISLDGIHDWVLDWMEVAPGFEVSYTINTVNDTPTENDVTLTITRTGKTDATGEGVLVSIPTHVWEYTKYYNNKTRVYPGNTAKNTYEINWSIQNWWVKSYKMYADYGVVTYADGTEDTFSMTPINVDTQVNKEHKGDASRSFHVHYATAVEDLAPTCTEKGYTGRTVCTACVCYTSTDAHPCDGSGCGSVVDWGTVVPATGHSYKVSGDQLICACGEALDGNGKVVIDGNTYYLQLGKLISGWVYEQLEGVDTYYYFYPETYTMAAGEAVVENMTYTFDENGVLIRGAFVTYPKGIRYFFAGRHLVARWVELEEGTYRIDDNGYVCYGASPVIESAQQPATWYMFNETTGLLEGPCNGFIEYEGDTYWCHEDGSITYGVVDAEGGKIFCGTKGLVLKNTSCYVASSLDSMGGLETGHYWCEEDGYITRDGFITVGTATYYMINYAKAKGFTKIGDDYYTFNVSNGKMYTDATMWVGTNSYGIDPGSYYFQADGRMYIPNLETGVKEIVEENGKLYIYIDGFKQTNGLFEVDGEYYYATSTGALATDTVLWVSQTNDLLDKGYYSFGTDGKVMKTGFMTVPSGYTYYLNDFVLAKGFTKIGDDYYIFNSGSGSMYKEATMWIGADNAYGFTAGYYYFDSEGKLYIPDLENGEKKIIEENGNLYFTIDGFIQKYGLFELDGDYYFATSAGPLATNTVTWVTQTNDYVAKGYYKFESDGKMMKTGFYTVPSGYTYYIDNLVLAKGLTKLGDDYYFFNNGSGSMYKDTSLWISADNAYGLEAGYYTFQSDGKMYIPDPNGAKAVIYENGYYYFTIDGFKQRNGLFELDGEYYYAGSTGALVTDSVIWVSQTNDLLPKANYKFLSDGKMMKTGFLTLPNGNTYYYEDLVLAKGLTKIGDDYYMFNAGSGMMYKDANMWVSAGNAYGFAAGTYYFDAEGKMAL